MAVSCKRFVTQQHKSLFFLLRVTQKIITLYFGEEFVLGNISLVNSKAFLFAFFLGWPLHIRHKNHHLPLHLVCRLLLATLGFITLYCFRDSMFFISFPRVDYGALVFPPPFPTGLWRFSLSSLSSSLIMTPTSPLPLSELDGVVLSLKVVHIRCCSSSN